METFLSFASIATFFSKYGPFGLLVIIWYCDIRAMRKQNEQYRNDTQKILADHKKYMDEIRSMYHSNVKLVEANEDLSKDLKEVVIMNTTAMTRLGSDINRNQYCPMLRVEKKKIGVQA